MITKMLIDWVKVKPDRKILGPRSVTPWPRANIFRPSHSINKYIARDLVREMRKKTTKFIPEFTFFLKEEKLQSLKGSRPCIAHLGLLLHLTHAYRWQCLTILYYIKIRRDKPQITRKQRKETVKNQEVTQSFNKKFLFWPESLVFAPCELKQTPLRCALDCNNSYCARYDWITRKSNKLIRNVAKK